MSDDDAPRRGWILAYLKTQYGIPQNPIHGSFRGVAGLGCGCGGGCGSSGQTNYTLNGLRGLGDDFSLGDSFTGITDWLQEPSPVLPAVANWLFYGGLIIAADLYIGGRGKRRR